MIAVGRHNWTFAGSDAGGRRAAAIYTLIETAKLNDVDPQAWLGDVLARLQDHPAKHLTELLPWNWKTQKRQQKLPRSFSAQIFPTQSTAVPAAFTGRVRSRRRTPMRCGSPTSLMLRPGQASSMSLPRQL